MFNPKLAKHAIEGLKKRGCVLAPGLTEKQFAHIESLLGAPFPADLKLLLSEAVPIQFAGEDRVPFPNWHEDPKSIVQEWHEQVERIFSFDIEKSGYWHHSFGSKPQEVEEAKKQALKVVSTWPPMVRVFAHRYMPTQPVGSGNPVLSVWQAVDTIYYGYDLIDYFSKEFGIRLLAQGATAPPEVPYWGPVFFDDES